MLFLLGKDMRRRLQAENDLADALAFRKAMEDSLVTGLRARDLARAHHLRQPGVLRDGRLSPPRNCWATARRRPTGRPSWPTNTSSGRTCAWPGRHVPPREGFESVFMRKDGARFPVLIIEAPLINAHGLQTGWMSAVLDISEQRRVEELSRAAARSGCRPPPGWPPSARWPRC